MLKDKTEEALASWAGAVSDLIRAGGLWALVIVVGGVVLCFGWKPFFNFLERDRQNRRDHERWLSKRAAGSPRVRAPKGASAPSTKKEARP